MRKAIIATVLAASAAVPAVANATPVRIYSVSNTSTFAHADFTLTPYSSTRCKVNVWASVWTYPEGRLAGTLGRNSLDGCQENVTFWANVPAHLKRGYRYTYVVVAINNDSWGQPNRHVTVKHFIAR